MGRLLKGGVWTNVEDEVLKSAIMKYGTNQWARVASLLHRKSAQQCKSRWYEWLSPTVKKTEWTQDENEKLLHLGKVLPMQWRTISDLIGRTPAQCVQQYNLLIDKTRADKEGLSEVDSLRQDDIDVRPESRPAKPDPIDMAEDEIDMLNEARARLANTQGKKAKRKGRERQLIMARRLAAVQQKRELAEVGIIGRPINNKKKPGVNYNEEIPFYQPVPRGFHDTTNEVYEAEERVIGKKVSELEFETREQREKRERQKDTELKRKREQEDLPSVLSNSKNSSQQQIKRTKLVLSEPKIGDEEIQTLLKLGHENDSMLKAAAAEGLRETTHLLGGYMSEREQRTLTMDRTPADTTNRLALEAENIKSLHYTKTPLLGGSNMELKEVVTGVNVNKGAVVDTPNTSLRANLLGGETPGTVGNQQQQLGVRFNSEHKRRLVQEGLRQMSAPRRDAKGDLLKRVMEMKEAEETLDMNETVENINGLVDQDDVDRLKEMERQREEEAMWVRRSQVVRRSLPRPTEVNESILRPPTQPGENALTEEQKVDELVKLEMLKMVHYDNIHQQAIEVSANGKYSLLTAGERKSLADSLAGKSRTFLEHHQYEDWPIEELRKAEAVLREEMEKVKLEAGHGDIGMDVFDKVWEECRSQVLYYPTEKRYTRLNLISKKDRVDSFRHLLDLYTSQYQELSKKCKRKEDKLNTFLGGYMTRSTLLQKAVSDVYDQIERNRIELGSLEKMREQEKSAIDKRIRALREDVERQKQRESVLQTIYSGLIKQRDSVLNE